MDQSYFREQGDRCRRLARDSTVAVSHDPTQTGRRMSKWSRTNLRMMRFPRSVQTRRTIQSAGQTQRVLACGRFAQRRRAPRRRCAFSARGWRSTGPRKNACTAAPH